MCVKKCHRTELFVTHSQNLIQISQCQCTNMYDMHTIATVYARSTIHQISADTAVKSQTHIDAFVLFPETFTIFPIFRSPFTILSHNSSCAFNRFSIFKRMDESFKMHIQRRNDTVALGKCIELRFVSSSHR